MNRTFHYIKRFVLFLLLAGVLLIIMVMSNKENKTEILQDNEEEKWKNDKIETDDGYELEIDWVEDEGETFSENDHAGSTNIDTTSKTDNNESDKDNYVSSESQTEESDYYNSSNDLPIDLVEDNET